MDLESYDLLYRKTKESLIFSTDLNRKAFIASHFSSSLTECESCISKAFEKATNLLEETNLQVNKLCEYIDNVVTLLQMLSDLIKYILESAEMTCCNTKLFPTTTGNIILTVFVHCKDSEWIYGHHLKCVETQLKALFRTCHELQLTYLMTLEKHYIFDMIEKEEQEILLEALNINMKIGEIVQALDIKTMAEQWKAYTVICEKYSNFLLDKHIYNRCTLIFASIIMDNIKTAMESDHDNKTVVRSLKVANFTIKILSKFSNVFKHAVSNNYDHVVELMEYIYMHNTAYLEASSAKTQQFIHLLMTNILSPTDGLCNILLQEERFLDYVSKIDIATLETNAFLGHIILITSIIKGIVQMKEDQVLNVSKRKLIDCVYRILPLGHYWFNMGLRFQNKNGFGSGNNFSLYEHLLTHVVALANTFNSEQYALLEKYMFEAVMSTDCYSAMFSSNLWVLITRLNHHLTSNTLSALVNMYQRLEKHKKFHSSPQEVHLSYLIGKLFEVSSNDYKNMMCKQIEPGDRLWAILRVSNLPDTLRRNIEMEILENLHTSFHATFESQDVTEKEVNHLILIMKTAATCMFSENSDGMEQCVVKLWSKVCYKNQYIQSDFDNVDTDWYYKYLEALEAVTDCIAIKLNSASVGKILHNMSTLLYNGNTEIILLLWNLFCKLTFNRFEDDNRYLINNIFKETCTILLQGVETWIRPNLLSTLSTYSCNEQFFEITSICDKDESAKEEYNLNCNVKNYSQSKEWKKQLLAATHFEYVHKCKRITTDDSREHKRDVQSANSNFDLGDFLLDDKIEEPSRKKAKLDTGKPDSLIEQLENTTSLLCEADHTVICNYKKRITIVIGKLRNIVS